MTLAYGDGRVAVYHCDHAQLAEIVKAAGGCDAVVVDAPYSKRTHDGHDGGAASANRPLKANGVRDTGRARREIDYDGWTPDDVDAFVDLWSGVTRGWMVSLTDSELVGDWRSAYETNGRIGFQPLPCVETGATVRLSGGGPSSWATYASVSRPRSEPWSKWRTLPGAYVGAAESKPWVGGKPLWLMSALVHDYTRRDDLVVDPCCGAGTTAIAAMRDGRRAIVGDRDEKAVAATVERIRAEIERAAALGRQVARWTGPEHPLRRAKQGGLAL